MRGERSKVVRFTNGAWSGIEVRRYKPDDGRHRDVTRRTLVGEAPDETAVSFLTRVFEIAPGGFSTLERHEHPHVVVILEGHGTVLLGEECHPVAAFDCVYVAPDTLHQFHAADAPLTFLCIVDRVRDRPTLPSAQEIQGLQSRGLSAKGPSSDD